MVVVEIENASPVPVALALAVRPYNPEGLAVVERIDLRGSTVAVDGRVALLLPRPPRRIAASTFRDGDSAATVLAGDAAERWRAPCATPPDWPRPPSSTCWPTAPRSGPPSRSTRGRRRAVPRPPTAGSWRRRRSRRPSRPHRRWPPGGRRRATAACASCCPTTASPRPSPPTAASSSCCTTASRSRPARPPTTGSGSAIPPTCWRRSTSTATTRRPPGPRLVPRSAAWRRVLLQPGQRVGQQRRRPRRPGPPLAPGARHPVRRGDRRTDRPRRPLDRPQAAVVRGPQGRRCRAGRPAPAGMSAEHLGPVDHYWDDFWGVAGLRAAAELLRAASRPTPPPARRRSPPPCGTTSRRHWR